jgi:glutamine amidotransferase
MVIVNYGMGNLHSVLKAIERLNYSAKISESKEDILNADKLLLPGVGHFGSGMKKLKELGYYDILNKKVLEDKTPILGICLGMQLFTRHSEEGDTEGFGWIDAETKRFEFSDDAHHKYRVPHIGWNTVDVAKKDNVLMTDILEKDENPAFYFVHSYFVECKNENDVLLKTEYGNRFVSGVHKGNIYGTQFHPEKSHSIGLNIIKNFIEKVN